jgi:flavin-dependent dehydrogenase
MIRWSPSDLGEYKEAKDFFQINVYRYALDQFLAKLATDAGAVLKTSTLVTDVTKSSDGQITGITTDRGEKIEADVTIAADGAISQISYKAGLREKWRQDEITLIVDCDFGASPQKMEEVIGSDEYGNHVYVSPLYPAPYVATMPNGFHVGLGQWLGRFTSRSSEKPYDYLRSVISSKPLKRFMDRVHAKPREYHAHLLPWMPRLPASTYGKGILLVGDAAGFPCPLEAEGINYAMVSGRIAAQVAAEAVPNEDVSASGLSVYEDRWRSSTIGEEFSAAKEWADLWAGIFFDPRQWKKITPMANNLMFWASWSSPHIRNFKRELSQYGEDSQFMIEFMKTYILPLLRRSGVPMFRTILKLGLQWLKTKGGVRTLS